ncbi:hypothetical protein M8756_17230 [Lutimaribacter sp. EGI FJ00015]|uniref:Uncharacterized protein n=1 Tax=Lutimaribacter degradans TaxID=2945989 RepID=A0ACC6A1B1_9RHOB|nr:hypothetical protein [Lutimaribacter sp. EGI FJ00013]MCM2563870.1 hypothetical protein [Lutimaribacter sp. EGI FJ00013]MCO0615058.1 hypothetical protein [Lutimaribacter sp. EGI FJ00015]MCO0637703.1 hypothetical protein [Lutimaribacter sp. EGI FJ00014]
MKVILFIGHHKVGSTSLQDFLARNSVTLAEAGILYPAVDFEAMASMLAMAVGRHTPEAVLPINSREPHNALAFRMLAERKKGKVPPFHKGLPALPQMIHAIRQQITFLQPKAVILAAEVFANFAPADPALIQRLKEIFPPESEVTVIATLRRIDEYLSSWHGQRLKFGHKLAPLREEGMRDYFTNIHFDYQLMLEGWLKGLPDARFILRNYAHVQESGGSVADFIAQSGLRFPRRMAAEKRTNESLHRGIYEIVRRGNHVLPKPQAEELRQLLRKLTPLMGLPKSSEIELFGAGNRAELVERFTPIHAFLEDASGKAPFFPDLEEARNTQLVPEAEVFRHALARLRRHENEIQNLETRAFLQSLETEIVS